MQFFGILNKNNNAEMHLSTCLTLFLYDQKTIKFSTYAFYLKGKY